MDIAGLSKLSADTLVLIVSVLGFLVSVYSKFEVKRSHTMLQIDLWVRYGRVPSYRGSSRCLPSGRTY